MLENATVIVVIMNYYNHLSKGYSELYGKEQRKKIEIIKKFLKTEKLDLLLDVGCGTGFSSMFECKVIGIDPSIELLKQAKISKVLGVAEFLPFKDKSFDTVISVTALHNFENKEKGTKEIKRVGKGQFALTVLRKSRFANETEDLLKKEFTVHHCIEEDKDFIYFLTR